MEEGNKRDPRVVALIAFGAVLAIAVIAVVVGRGGSDDDGGSSEATEVEIEDLKVGDGDEAKAGDQLAVQYVGTLENGTEFDASSGQPFEFQLGAGEVIPGWDQGLEGMKVGGKRRLVIPPELGYGAQGQPPDIPPNATLIFEIDLESIN